MKIPSSTTKKTESPSTNDDNSHGLLNLPAEIVIRILSYVVPNFKSFSNCIRTAKALHPFLLTSYSVNERPILYKDAMEKAHGIALFLLKDKRFKLDATSWHEQAIQLFLNATDKNNVSFIESLLGNKNFNPTIGQDKVDTNLLRLVIHRGKIDIVKAILKDKRMDLSACNYVVFNSACKRGLDDILNLLLDNLTDTEVKLDDACHLARREPERDSKHSKCVISLINRNRISDHQLQRTLRWTIEKSLLLEYQELTSNILLQNMMKSPELEIINSIFIKKMKSPNERIVIFKTTEIVKAETRSNINNLLSFYNPEVSSVLSQQLSTEYTKNIDICIDVEDYALAIIAEGNLECANQLFEAGLGDLIKDSRFLEMASKQGHLQLVKKLLPYPLNKSVTFNNKAILLAWKNGHQDVFRELLNDWHHIIEYVLFELLKIEKPCLDIYMEILGYFPIKDIASSLLYESLKNKKIDIANFLLELEVVGKVIKDSQPLEAASKHGYLDLVKKLLSYPTTKSVTFNNEAILQAWNNDHDEVLRVLLIDGHYEPNFILTQLLKSTKPCSDLFKEIFQTNREHDIYTLLKFSIENGKKEIAYYLLEQETAGLQLDTKASELFQLALANDYEKVAMKIVPYIKITIEELNIAIEKACQSGNLDLIKLILNQEHIDQLDLEDLFDTILLSNNRSKITLTILENNQILNEIKNAPHYLYTAIESSLSEDVIQIMLKEMNLDQEDLYNALCTEFRIGCRREDVALRLLNDPRYKFGNNTKELNKKILIEESYNLIEIALPELDISSKDLHEAILAAIAQNSAYRLKILLADERVQPFSELIEVNTKNYDFDTLKVILESKKIGFERIANIDEVFQLACAQNHSVLVEHLIRSSKLSLDVLTTSFLRIRNSDTEMIKLFVDDGRIDLTVSNNQMLKNSIFNRRIDSVKLLLSDKIVQQSIYKQEDIIELASKRDYTNIAELLLPYVYPEMAKTEGFISENFDAPPPEESIKH